MLSFQLAINFSYQLQNHQTECPGTHATYLNNVCLAVIYSDIDPFAALLTSSILRIQVLIFSNDFSFVISYTSIMPYNIGNVQFSLNHQVGITKNESNSIQKIFFRGYHTAVFISARISRLSVDIDRELDIGTIWKQLCHKLFIIRSTYISNITSQNDRSSKLTMFNHNDDNWTNN